MARKAQIPLRKHLLGEALAGFEALSTPAALVKAPFRKRTEVDRSPVIVLPGFGANDLSTAPLRTFLKLSGYVAEGWGLGQNLGGRGLVETPSEISDRWRFDRELATAIDVEVPALCDRFFDQLEKRIAVYAGPVSLIGWSLGGYIAREAAREFPDRVKQVITLGSPINGGPKHTSIAPLFKLRGVNLELIEQTIEARASRPIEVPITAIYGSRDGIVSDYAALDTTSPNVRNIQVSASHLGMGVNAKVWDLIVRALEAGDRAEPAPPN